MKTIFVTGTDTGVGKTLVSRLLIEYFVAQGLKVAPMKPVASGADWTNNQLYNEDALTLINAANCELDYSSVNPYVFQPPIAPHIAAAKNKTSIKLKKLNQCYQMLSSVSDCVIVEGAGGWQVPLNSQYSMADWVSQNQWPVVLVVGLRLGCINHARLSYLDILAKNNVLAGWVINTIDANTLEAEAIINDLIQYIDAPFLGCIPWLPKEQLEGKQAADSLDFSQLTML